MRLRSAIAALALLALGACDKQTDEPAPYIGEPRALRLDNDTTLTVDDGSTAVLDFTVEPSGAVFDHNLLSPGCQLSLRLADDLRRSPEELSLDMVSDGTAAGRYKATIGTTGASDIFRRRICLALKLSSGELLFSQPVVVQSPGYEAGITGMRFLKSLNPSLPDDITLTLDGSSSTFTGRIPVYQSSMQLVASFDCEGADRVEVGGVEQTSGRSVNDFRGEVVYTVHNGRHESRYTVRVTNFTGLPVISIDTPGGQPILSKEEWIEGATIRIDGAGRFDDMQAAATSIRGRGNSTWEWPKKPYNIKLDTKAEVLGMPEHKRWCLLANYMDRTLLRNKTAYYLASQTSLDWTPRCEFAELILNGEYMGQYLVAEHVKVGKERVDITEMTPEDDSGEALTGGYLLELDFHVDNIWQWRTPRNVPFAVKSPDDDKLTQTQFDWIRGHIDAVEKRLYGADFADPDNGYRSLIDAQSFVDYWLVYELTVNHELGNPGSVFLHKERGGRIVAGPVWDFDWGTFSYKASPAAQWGLFIRWAWWYGRLFEDEWFRSLAAERWRVLKPRFLTALDHIAEQRDYISLSAAGNFALWKMTTDTNGDEQLPFGQAVDRMAEILAERIDIVDRELSAW